MQTSMFRFLRMRRADGENEYPLSRLLDVRKARASAEVARALDLRVGDAILVLRRVLDYSGVPSVLDEMSLPAAQFKGLTKERYDAFQGSMYGFFETEFGVRMLRANEQVRAVAADPTTAEILKLGIGAPLLSVERIAFTYGDKPVEHRKGLCTTRNHYYFNELF
jgi:GntR family transcriptional regulator